MYIDPCLNTSDAEEVTVSQSPDLEDSYLASPLQQGMLFHSLYEPHSQMYVRQIIYTLRESLDVVSFRVAWERVVQRHPAMRSSFRWKADGNPVQKIYRHVALPLDQQDWRDLDANEEERQLEVYIRADRRRGLNVEEAPLMRLTLIRMGDTDYRLVWTFHHTMSDGFSDVLILKEVFAFYDALRQGSDLQLPPATAYREHCEWLEQQDVAQAKEFWQSRLKGFVTPTTLSSVAFAESGDDAERGEQSLKLTTELTSQLKDFAERHDLALSTLLHGAWAVLLSRYSGEQDVVFGAVRGCRRSALGGRGAANVVGPFINTLPMRLRVSPDMTKLALLKELRRQWFEMREYEHTPLATIQEWSELPQSTPLFESILAFDRRQINAAVKGDSASWQHREMRSIQAQSNYPLTLASYGEEEFLLTFHYDRASFDDATITQLLEHLKRVFAALVADEALVLSSLSLLTPEELELQLKGWNETSREYPERESLAELFERQVAKCGEAVALVSASREVSYAELNERANRLARVLRMRGVGVETAVGICLPRSVEMVVSILAVLKAGGVYVPLDAEYPLERLRYICRDATVALVLTELDQAAVFEAAGVATLCLNDLTEEIEAQVGTNLECVIDSEQLAYVVYTSGSTGQPKGVAVTQRSVSRLLFGVDYVRLDEKQCVLQGAPLTFDAATFELWGALLHGGRCVLAEERVLTSRELGRLVRQHGVTTMWLTASLFNSVVDEAVEELRGVEQLLVGGEALSVPHIRKTQEALGETTLVNGYGPTEGTTFTCCEQIGPVEAGASGIAIGCPIGNTTVYVLDERMRPVVAGVRGELYIGGAGLARGYVGRPELTAEKFVPHPFSHGERLYRTGDVVRQLRDGRIEFVGRVDQQVKVRGHRIELGEIETVLREHAEIRDAVVVVREQVLVGYVVKETGATGGAAEWRRYLKERLPEYMVPGQLVELPELPLNANGKVDRKALPEAGRNSEAEYVGPRTPVEEVVASIWSEVLGVEQVGVHDNFFELGGHSLLATRVVSQVRQALQVEIALRRLFEEPTVAGLAAEVESVLRGGGESQAPRLERVGRDVALPLSYAQQRLWFIQQLDPSSVAYNVPCAFRFNGRLDREALGRSLRELVRRHESLRTRFPNVGGTPQQEIGAAEDWDLTVIDLQSIAESEREAQARQLIGAEARRPFDLEQGLLFRAQLFVLSESEHVLLLTMHHIISDGWSLGVMLRELRQLYGASVAGAESPLPELMVQYADYAVWQREWLTGDVLDQQLTYWKARLSGAPEVLELPTDKPRPTVPNLAGASHSFSLSLAVSEQLKELSRQEGVTLYMLLLAAFQTLLYRYTGQTDIVVGTGIANRGNEQVENLIGFFVNTLVLRTDLSGNPSFRELMKRVREVCLGAYAHQDLPFEKLVEELQPERSASHNPLYQVAFGYHDLSLDNSEWSNLSLEYIPVHNGTTKSDLRLFIAEKGKQLHASFEYSTALFELSTIKKLFENLEALVTSFAADPEQRIHDVPLFKSEMAAALGVEPSRMERVAPLTPTQRDLYLAHLIDEDDTTYNISASLELGDTINPDLWEKAVTLVVEAEDITRTRFFTYNNQPYQFVDAAAPVAFEFLDLTETHSPLRSFKQIIEQKTGTAYQLHSGPLVRNTLLKDQDGKYYAIVAAHHIIFDGYAWKIFLQKVSAAYETLNEGESPNLTRARSFYEYAGESLARFDTPDIERFWSRQFSDVTPLEFHVSSGHEAKSESQRLALNGPELEEIRTFCKTNNCTLATYFRSLYAVLLGRYADTPDAFVVYDVIGGRPEEFKNTIGCFYQVVPTIFPGELLNADTSIADYLRYVQGYKRSLGERINISTFLQRKMLKEKVRPFYNYRNFYGIEVLGKPGFITPHTNYPEQEIHFAINDTGNTVELALNFNTKYFPDLNFLERLLSVSRQITGGATNLKTLDILLDADRESLSVTDTWTTSSPSQCIHRLFETQVEKTPENVAVVYDGTTLTYRELNHRANLLARRLQEMNVGPESLVGICVEPSLEMVIGLLGILKAGGAYVPLDPHYPAERLAFMLHDARMKVLLTQPWLDLPEHSCDVVHLDAADTEPRATGDELNLDNEAPAENLAYIIYTSGSTGTPKGTLVTHANVARLFTATQSGFAFDDGDVWSLFHSYAFDFSVWELWGALLYGGRLVIVPEWIKRSPEAFHQLLCKERVTVLNQTPAAFNQLMRADAQVTNDQLYLRLVIFGGEALVTQNLRPWFQLHGDKLPQLVNMYGITETTVHVTERPLTMDDAQGSSGSVIGKAISDLNIHLLDRAMRPVPIGLAGEIYVGGAGVSRGYLNHPSLTAERFVPNPFTREEGGRLYRSGDLARLLPDGDVEYLGRIDQQIKIRGFRIELSEIEVALNEHPSVSQSVVVAGEDVSGDKRLVAYVVLKHEESQGELRSYLKERLPEYMVPAVFMSLPELPLTAHGKLDRRALPAPDQSRPELEAEFAAPSTPVEEVLAGIWCTVLGLDRVGVHDNFFELGGHSLLATVVMTNVRSSFHVQLPLRKLFEFPTVAGLAVVLEEALREEQGTLAPPIERVARETSLPLSYAQQRLWFVQQLEPGSAAYNVPCSFRLEGELDRDALERSLRELVQRHESLRTRFPNVGGAPQQQIGSAEEWELSVIDLQSFPTGERVEQARHLAGAEARRPFDLEHGPVFRTQLLVLDQSEHVLLLTMHHIISDGWSLGVLMRELRQLYSAFVAGEESPLPELAVQFADYAVWQREWLAGEVLETQLAYWKDRLSGAPEVLELPTDRPRPVVPTLAGASQSFSLSADVSERLKELSREEGVTLYMVLLAAFQTLLYRYTGQTDLVVGTGIANRSQAQVENLIGFFVNTLVLRTDMSGNPSFRELLARVKEVCLGAYTHQDMPFEKLVEELQPERVIAHHPLFQVIFGIHNNRVETLELAGLKLSRFDHAERNAKFDITLSLKDGAEGLTGFIEYSTELFDDSTISRFVGNYRQLLESAAKDVDQSINRLSLLTSGERRQLQYEWNDTRREYSSKCIHELFEEQVERTPDAIAVVYAEQELTYVELNERANQLAHFLRAKGVGRESVVGICMEKSPEMLVGLLGVLKSGAAYLPLDPHYPIERLGFMIEDSHAGIVLTQTRLLRNLSEQQAELVCLDQDRKAIECESKLNPDRSVSSESLAYVIYTSGSTGKPKGAMIEHGSLANYLCWITENLLNRIQSLPAITGLPFDASLKQLFGPLLLGKAVWLLPDDAALQPEVLLQEISARTSVGLNCVPSLWKAMLEMIEREQVVLPEESLTTLFVGGEQVSEDLIARSHAALPHLEIWNLYGPSEATANASVSRIKTGEAVTIGHPIGNTRLYILDSNLEQVPAIVAGELYIGGEGVARGYLNRADLTAEKFIPDPFSEGARLYKTGDLCRYLGDGRIEFLGRIDHQVKIRGYRIELGEIEAAVASHPFVRETAVLVREDVPGDKRIVAYVVASQDNLPTGDELRTFLQQKLPDYMVPSAFVALDQLPLTAHGKLDRRALPAPDQSRPQVEDEFAAPCTPIEEVLAGIWCAVLGLDRVGMHDNFFELGGHSLLATIVMSDVLESFHVQLPLRKLFEFPTVGLLAQRIEEAIREEQGTTEPPLVRVGRESLLPLSYGQQRLWFIQQLEPESTVYNMSSAFRLNGRLDREVLRRSLRELVRRHESLRTRFPNVGGTPQQEIGAVEDWELSVTDLHSLPAGEREERARQLAVAEARGPFDLEQGPVFRAQLLVLSEIEHVLLLTMHHIVSDGWSLGVMLRELRQLYAAFLVGARSPLPELNVQYGDYAVWQREWLTGEVLERQLEYWKERLSGAPEVLELPVDKSRPVMPTHQGGYVTGSLPAELSERLRELGRDEGVTLYMLLVAVFQTLLFRYTGQTDIVVGTGIANRGKAEIENLVGFFVNTLVLRTDLSGNPSFRELLARVREVCLGAYTHQDLPFEKLVEELQPERRLSQTPLFQVLFALQNAPRESLSLADVALSRFQLERSTTHFDLMLGIKDGEEEISYTFEYSTELFEAETITRLGEHYERLLTAFVKEVDQAIGELVLQTPAELELQLKVWNETAREFPERESLAELFERQVVTRGDAAALVSAAGEVSYAELNERANRLARVLRAQGVEAETAVGICLPRSAEMVVSILAVLKAGGVYVPLDGGYPVERLRYMCRDANVALVLTELDQVEVFASAGVATLCLEELVLDEQTGTNLECLVDSEQLAYIVYTSGSTGQPKGVAITQRGVSSLIFNSNYLELGPSDTVPQLSNPAFDALTFELWGTLLGGGRLLLLSQEETLAVGQLQAKLQEQDVSALFLTTALFNEVARQGGFAGVGTVLFGGEAVDVGSVRAVLEGEGRPGRLLHVYGPTEATTFSSWEEVVEVGTGARTVPIGTGLSNRELYVLDERMQPVVPGVRGELYIGGAGLARGYVGRPELTAEKFVPHPFSHSERLYRTGDVVRQLRDGRVEFVGRVDQQVKVRGHRIELGEIETVLREHAEIRDAVVVVREQVLVGYVVKEAEATGSAAEWRRYLKERLPEYMVPGQLVELPELPLNANGKVDRKALPEVGRSSEADYVGPRTPVEEVVASIWSEVLGVEQVGVHDNFFELGGHSLLATRVVSRLREVFPLNLPVNWIFHSPTIAKLAEHVESEGVVQGIDVSMMADIAVRLNDLSEFEVQAMLANRLDFESVA